MRNAWEKESALAKAGIFKLQWISVASFEKILNRVAPEGRDESCEAPKEGNRSSATDFGVFSSFP